MEEILNKSDMSEEDVKFHLITPAITSKWKMTHVTMETSLKKVQENKITDGKVNIKGNKPTREKAKRCDYVLWYNKATPLAIVEAKNNNRESSFGMQQAIEYGIMLDVPFVYTSNGDSFFEHDFTTGLEKEFAMSDFPTCNELYSRWKNIGAYKKPETKDKTKGENDDEKEAYDVPQCFDKDLMDIPFCTSTNCYPPRYYQRNAVNRTLEAVSKGQKRILLAMATGTGKTYTAFQIVWRLLKAQRVNKVLYLADRNNLVDQSISQDFKPLEKVIHKINFQKEDKSKIGAYSVYFALYQQLDPAKHNDDEDKIEETDEEIEEDVSRYKDFFDPNFFDLIIVDECHRGSAQKDSRWRKILEYFSDAIQIGMTATPKETRYVSNIDYFGKPIYQYSLKQGIDDGFLAPFKVIRPQINIDDGWCPYDGQTDIYGNIIENRIYNLSDYDYSIIIQDRINAVASEITRFLKETDRMSKTIVFCPTEDAAERMRRVLNNLNADMVERDKQGNVKKQYVVRITGSDEYGKNQLDYFISPNEKYPVIATTSELLTTGVDCKMVKLIAIDKMINSMTEFKQIIGRGTRLRWDEGKTHFTIMDFRNISRKFADPSWDGPIEQDDDFGTPKEPGGPNGGGTPPPPRKLYTTKEGDVKVEINFRSVSYYDTNGKLLQTKSIEDYTKESVCGIYRTLDNFINAWNEEQKKSVIRDMLKNDKGIDLESIKKDHNMTDTDDFDFICHIAFDQKPLTRRERANNVKKRDIFGKYGDVAKEVINALLDKYAELGIYDIEGTEVLKQSPFTNYGKPSRIASLFGGNDKYRQAIKELEKELYVA